MTLDIAIVFLVMGATFILLVSEKLSADLVAMMALTALLMAGVLDPQEAFHVFGNEAVITIASMFVLSAGLEHAGVIGRIARVLNSISGKSDLAVLVVTLPIVAVLSAFVNNTPVVVVFIPVMFSLARERGIKPSRLLIPLSFASIVGGTCTLIGTSTNIIVSAEAEQLGQAPFSMFELSRLGVILVAAAIIYLLFFGRRLLPERDTLASLLPEENQKQYLTEVIVVASSRLIGKKLGETGLHKLKEGRILEIVRFGDSMAWPLEEVTLRQGDRLRFSTVLSSMMELKNLEGLQFLPEEKMGLALVGAQKAMLMECIVGPASSLVGHTIKEIDLRRRFGALLLAVHRKGVNLRQKIANIRLQYGDTLLIEGPDHAIRRVRESGDFLLLMDVPSSATRKPKRWIAMSIVILVVALASANLFPISVLAMMGAALMLLTRCLDVEEAYKAVSWKTLLLICGMLALGMAMEKTHATEYVVNNGFAAFSGLGPWAMMSLLFLFTSLLTQFLTNNAVAVLITPLAIQTATLLHVDPRPFIVAVAIGASACFASPLGYQTNTLVYSAGGYQFKDFLRVGVPLNILIWILGSALIPYFWPF